MSNKIASKRYSVALFDTVKNEELDSLLADVQSLSESLKESQELSSLLKSPLTKNEIKSNILLKVISGLTSEKILVGLINTLKKNKRLIINHFESADLKNIDVISDENIKSQVLSNSIFAVCKSGTASLQVCNSNVPSIIVYKLNFINLQNCIIIFFIVFYMFTSISWNVYIILINKDTIRACILFHYHCLI